MSEGKIIDLFAGVGGLSLGFELAGLTTVLANEYDSSIAEAYTKNRKKAPMVQIGAVYIILQIVFAV